MTGLLVNVAAAIGQMAEDVESLEQVMGWARSGINAALDIQ